jgi:hypothetical protein
MIKLLVRQTLLFGDQVDGLDVFPKEHFSIFHSLFLSFLDLIELYLHQHLFDELLFEPSSIITQAHCSTVGINKCPVENFLLGTNFQKFYHFPICSYVENVIHILGLVDNFHCQNFLN